MSNWTHASHVTYGWAFKLEHSLQKARLLAVKNMNHIKHSHFVCEKD